MQENWGKLQMMGKTARQQEQLKAQVEEAGRPQWAEHVTEEAEIVGTALTRSGRIGTKTDQENDEVHRSPGNVASNPVPHPRRLSRCSSDPGKLGRFLRLGDHRTFF